jgi:multiple sugar transport system ATP-binding protein
MVYVTHDQVEAMTLADKIVLLQPLAGRAGLSSVAQVGHPLELYHHPANRFVAGFIGSPAMNFIDAQVSQVRPDHITGSARAMRCEAQISPHGLAVGQPITFGIRPEHVQVGQGPLSARVHHVERLGELSYLYLDVDGAASLLAKTPRDDIRIDERVPFSLPPQAMHVFRADGSAQPRHRR